MNADHTSSFYTSSRHWWRMFTRTIWLIGLFGAGTIGVLGWRIYQRQSLGIPVLLNNKSEFRTLMTNDSINRHDSRDRILVRGQ